MIISDIYTEIHIASMNHYIENDSTYVEVHTNFFDTEKNYNKRKGDRKKEPEPWMLLKDNYVGY